MIKEHKSKKLKSRILESQKVNNFVFLGPYFILFFVFIVLAVLAAMFLSLTYFNTIEFPRVVGLNNFIDILTVDYAFMQDVLPNTLKFALIVGPVGYLLSFFLAWSLAQLPHKIRTVLAIIFYSPSMTAGVAMVVVWVAIFSGDQSGYLNSLLLKFNLISEPIQWLVSSTYLMPIMILVAIWGSMGVGFLAMLSGIINIDKEIVEAAYVDGISNKFQEIFYIIIPTMKPQMLFGAVMMVVSTFQAGAIGVQLSGSNPTPQNAGQLILNHIEDYGFIRFEMGYAAALSLILLVIVAVISRLAKKYLVEKD